LVCPIVLYGVDRVLDIIPNKWENCGCVQKENSAKNIRPY
jgi:hypothetical protein